MSTATLTKPKAKGRPRINAPQVRKGQTWVSKRTARKLIIEQVSRKDATVKARYTDDNTQVEIKIDRLRPTSEGYALAEEAPANNGVTN